MARTSKAELLQPFLAMANSAPITSSDFEVSLGSVARAMEELSAAAPDLPSGVEEQLRSIAYAFAADRSVQAYWGDPGRQKQLLKLLRDGEDVYGRFGGDGAGVRGRAYDLS